ncbi:MAG: fibronectin type III domain-containing protein, partial [Elusimicrobia bacterium]|nr:fibronectin type III domain-containing protein [Elusimicrobiota bacterium]
QAAAINGNGVMSDGTLIASTYTLANSPSNPAVAANTPSALALTWGANSNPGYTLYQVAFSSDNFQSFISTPVPFSANYTSLGATLTGLVTGTLYTFHIAARNQYGVETAPAILSTITSNGGGPPGTLLAAVTDPAQPLYITGTINSGRTVILQAPANAFAIPVTILISSRSAVPQCKTGTLDAAIELTAIPETQPLFPIRIGIAYSVSEPGIGGLDTLTMRRHDSASNTCVPLETQVNGITSMAVGTSNHLSAFQLAQLQPQSAVGAARAFPNPLYTKNQGYITFDRLPASARVRIFTLRGEEVFDQEASGSGLAIWRAVNKTGRPVASGIYLVAVESKGERQILKVAVIR